MAFEFPIRVYWEDTDAGGIVFYANYLKFFERARTEWLRSLGVGQHNLREQTGGMFVVTDAQLRYLRPARLDDELIVTASLLETDLPSDATERGGADKARACAEADQVALRLLAVQRRQDVLRDVGKQRLVLGAVMDVRVVTLHEDGPTNGAPGDHRHP